MTFTTKLNVGDQIWHLKHNRIQFSTISEIAIVYQPQRRAVPEIHYRCIDINVAEEKEGTEWWRTRQDLVNYLLSDQSKPKTDIEKAFEKLFNPDLTPKPTAFNKPIPPDPTLKPVHPTVTLSYDELFGPTPPYLKREVVRISLPPKPRNELSQLADEL